MKNKAYENTVMSNEIDEYFNRKSTEWNIFDFLGESNEEPFQRKIDRYIKSLKTIVDREEGKKKEKAKYLLQRYREASDLFGCLMLKGCSPILHGSHWGTDDLLGYLMLKGCLPIWIINQIVKKQKDGKMREEGIINDFHQSEKRSREKDHGVVPDDDKVSKCKKIYEFFPLCDVISPLQHEQVQQPRAPEHQIYEDSYIDYNVNEAIYINGIHLSQEYQIINLSDRNASSPVQKILTKADKQLLKTIWDSLEPSKENHKTIRQEKWNAVIKPLVKKYQKNLVPKSVFDDFPLDLAIEEITERPYTGTFNYREHHDSLWYVQRVSIGCHQDGIFEVNVNAMTFEIGFFEVVGNALIVDITKLNGDLDKISLFYQRQHHTQRGATGDQLVCLESYGIIVYWLYIVDKLTEFCIPNSKNQLYALEEVIEKVYMLKITPNYVQTHINTTESPVEASPSKNSKVTNR
ncbi:13315_t:CDS:10 [Entrophospora sp. SA101]|nr:13315_t:CDS:10 [Entrophospora sp. SA101]